MVSYEEASVNLIRRIALVALAALALPAAAQPLAQQMEAARQADVNTRIAARWDLLSGDTSAPVIGDRNAPITIVEFFDYTCPYCKAAEPRLEALLKRDRNVKLVLKEFPILQPVSLVASRAALAANNQGKYPAFHQAMMRFEGRLTEDDVVAMAKAAKLDIARLKRDMNAPEISDQFISVFNQARGIRVFQTPAYIVGGPKGAHILSSDSASIDFAKEVAAARK
jgi:protein-disulfide isomerase